MFEQLADDLSALAHSERAYAAESLPLLRDTLARAGAELLRLVSSGEWEAPESGLPWLTETLKSDDAPRFIAIKQPQSSIVTSGADQTFIQACATMNGLQICAEGDHPTWIASPDFPRFGALNETQHFRDRHIFLEAICYRVQSTAAAKTAPYGLGHWTCWVGESTVEFISDWVPRHSTPGVLAVAIAREAADMARALAGSKEPGRLKWFAPQSERGSDRRCLVEHELPDSSVRCRELGFDGVGWTIEADGRRVRFGDSEGARFLHRLVLHEGKDVPASVRMTSEEGEAPEDAILDAETVNDVSEALREIEEREGQAGARENPLWIELKAELEKAQGLRSARRKFAGLAKLNGDRNGAAFRRLLREIKQQDPALANEIRSAVRTPGGKSSRFVRADGTNWLVQGEVPARRPVDWSGPIGVDEAQPVKRQNGKG